MSSKVSRDTLYEAVREVLHGTQHKRRKFLETVELQISLKNYDPQKDKRFSGTVRSFLSPLSHRHSILEAQSGCLLQILRSLEKL
uniref:Ribosomal protein L10a n=1 Tax=Vombatus ursinus TaxID=29139 RepID=A0A4X2K9S0_VOMUR